MGLDQIIVDAGLAAAGVRGERESCVYHVKLNISSNDNSLLVEQINVGTVNNFMTVCLVRWWPVHVQLLQIYVQYGKNWIYLVNRNRAGTRITRWTNY